MGKLAFFTTFETFDCIYIYSFGEECSRHIKELQKSLKAHFSERERADSVFVGECRRIIEMKPEELWGR